MLILPLVENAIKHGMNEDELPLRVRLTAVVIDGILSITGARSW